MPRALALSDEQMTALIQASQPLQPHDRSAFLTELAARFEGREDVGDGELFRAVAELQRQFFTAPQPNEQRAPHQKRFGRVAS